MAYLGAANAGVPLSIIVKQCVSCCLHPPFRAEGSQTDGHIPCTRAPLPVHMDRMQSAALGQPVHIVYALKLQVNAPLALHCKHFIIPVFYLECRYGWGAYFTTLYCALGAAVLLLSPMVNLKNFAQREAAKKAALDKPKTA